MEEYRLEGLENEVLGEIFGPKDRRDKSESGEFCIARGFMISASHQMLAGG
jgi:hypothetical protein